MGLPDLDEACGIAKGQRLEEEGVDNSEQGGVGADAESNGKDGRSGEDGAAAE
jgi:hypothetical protein